MVTIGRATVKDAPDIAKVYVDTWRSAYAGILPDRNLIKMSHDRQMAEWAWVIRNRADTQPVFVATELRHGVVGFISVGGSRVASRPGDGPFASSSVGEVFTLYVRPEFHERGIGRQLLAAGLGTLSERSFTRAILWVLRDNPARFFYERMGGERVAQRREWIWGAELDETAYGWLDLKKAITRIGSCSAS